MTFDGTEGDDHLTGTEKDDVFHPYGGTDVIEGLGGDDEVFMYDIFEPGSRFNGGEGFDDLFFNQLPSNYVFNSANFVNYELVAFYGSGPTRVTLAAECASAGQSLEIVAPERGSVIDASAVAGDLTAFIGASGRVVFSAGSGNDVIYGGGVDDSITAGAGADLIFGGGGGDKLTGGGGADTFGFIGADGNDRITDFTVGEDHISVLHDVARKFSDLTFTSDGHHGGTLVIFKHGSSVDLRHVAQGEITKDMFIFQSDSAPPQFAFGHTAHQNLLDLGHVGPIA